MNVPADAASAAMIEDARVSATMMPSPCVSASTIATAIPPTAASQRTDHVTIASLRIRNRG
jgi:hypothetical protein